jgi:isopenicillin-N N-acyltransferase-like protein
MDRKQRLATPVTFLLSALAVLALCSGLACQKSAVIAPSPAPTAAMPTDLAQAPAAQEVHGTVETLGEGADALKLLHVWGTPREMGYAQGKLAAAEVNDFCTKIIAAMTAGMGVSEEDLDQAWAAMEPYVPPEYLEEMEGLAEGAGVDPVLIKRAHAIPDLSEMDCTFFAAWGDFTADGHFIQLRALDYATEAHIQDNPAIIVYHPDDGPAYVDVGWCGFIGMVTGMNAEGVCMSEIGDDFDKGNQTLEAEPMPFVMRDVIRKATSLDEGVGIVRAAKRTSSFLYLIGDAKLPGARALKTGPKTFEVYDQQDTPYGPLGNVLWMSMGADSGWNQKIRDALAEQAGKLTVDSAIEGVTGKCKTGDLHTVYFDATDLKLWVANADVDGSPAYDEGFVTFDFGAATQRPGQ